MGLGLGTSGCGVSTGRLGASPEAVLDRRGDLARARGSLGTNENRVKA